MLGCHRNAQILTALYLCYALYSDSPRQVGCMNETATQVAFDPSGRGLVEGAPGSLSDPPTLQPPSSTQLLPHGQLFTFPTATSSCSAGLPRASGGMGVLHMAYQGMRAASVLEKVEAAAVSAQQQQQQQVLLQELMGLQALIAAASGGGQPQSVEGEAAQPFTGFTGVRLQPAAHEAAPSRGPNEAVGSVNLPPLPSMGGHGGPASVLRRSQGDLVLREAYASQPGPKPRSRLHSRGASMTGLGGPPPLGGAEPEEAYSYDGFEEESISPYRSASSEDHISEEDEMYSEQDPAQAVQTVRGRASVVRLSVNSSVADETGGYSSIFESAVRG